MYLFFDTETTGLPRNYKAPVTDINNWPRLVQLAWMVFDEGGKQLEIGDYIIKPEGFIIPKEAANIHGITTQKAMAEGVNLHELLVAFNELVEESKVLVAHNISFDEKIMGAEFVRKEIKSPLFKKKRLCTMHASTNYCRLPGNYGYKWPRLSELHIKLFGENFEEAHNARADIEATARCFWKLREMGIM
ncbi:3'-5' exonuclease [Marinilabiliaceae bacterium JC017]|nr:3'-5' exonuclease [Marinilabiliaceae bacterium JC017]